MHHLVITNQQADSEYVIHRIVQNSRKHRIIDGNVSELYQLLAEGGILGAMTIIFESGDSLGGEVVGQLVPLMAESIHQLIVLVEKKPGKNAPLWKLFGTTEVVEVKALTKRDKSAFIKQTITEKKVQVSRQALLLLEERMPLNRLIIEREIEKLRLGEEYLSDMICNYQEANNFQLIDYLWTKNYPQFFHQAVKTLKSDSDYFPFLSFVYNQFRLCYLIKMGGEEAVQVIKKELKLLDFQISNLKKGGKYYSLEELQALLERLGYVDYWWKYHQFDKMMLLFWGFCSREQQLDPQKMIRY